MQDLCELLASNPYPGRGIVVGKDVVYYWIMGRSVNSRNRVFVPTDDGIRTQAHDPALLEDPSLIIYRPVRTMGKKLVVTNGDQTDTIVDAGSFRDGCMAREFEPDAPNFTPRISAVVNADGSLQPQLITADKGQCAAAGCHEWQDVVAATENWGGQQGVNPHVSHQGEAIDCSNCHSVHGESNMYCNACHSYEVPAGWASPASN